jgi:small-conductance mechanosensitive channel
MFGFIDRSFLNTVVETSLDWLFANVLNVASLIQILILISTFYTAKKISVHLAPWLEDLVNKSHFSEKVISTINRLFISEIIRLTNLFFLWLIVGFAENFGFPNQLITIVASLLSAFVIINLTSKLVMSETWSKVITTVVWGVAALNMVNLLHPTIEVMEGITFAAGKIKFSMFTLVKGLVVFTIFLKIAQSLAKHSEKIIQEKAQLTASIQILFTKVAKAVIYLALTLITLKSIGVDLMAFTVFSGTIGVALAFGLQKIFANLAAGITLLINKTIQEGDVIEIGDSFGWVTSLGARYVSVVTREGKEHLIPNEELISKTLINWSYSDKLVRLKIEIPIAINSDVRLAIELAQKAALEVPRILKTPQPECIMKGFGDSCIELETRVWINDPVNGIGPVKSEVLLLTWDNFKDAGIKFPYPRRDLAVKEMPVQDNT